MSTFEGNTLYVVHTEFDFVCEPSAPHASRQDAGCPKIAHEPPPASLSPPLDGGRPRSLGGINHFDAICAIAVAFLWQSSWSRYQDAMYVFYRDGVLALDSRFCDSFPKDRRAIYATAFIAALKKLPLGASFEKYGPLGAIGTFPQGSVRRDVLYLVFDDKGVPLSTRRNASAAEMGSCPGIATFVIGGTKGFQPYTARSLAAFLSDAGAEHVAIAALGKEQQHASSVAAHLQLMNDVGDLRNACACTFYGRASSSSLVSVDLILGRLFLRLARIAARYKWGY